MIKHFLIHFCAIAFFGFAALTQADPIQDMSMQNYQAGWYPNFIQGDGPLTCPKTCDAWVGGVAEQEYAGDFTNEFKYTHVCKITRYWDEPVPTPDERITWLYGNQFDDKTACYVGTPNGVYKSDKYMCLCVDDCIKPDLIVRKIYDPVWDPLSGHSIIKVDVSNIGKTDAANSYTHLIDPDVGITSAVILGTPPIPAGGTTTLVFKLNYWVFDPDAELHVTADYKNYIDECDETNNVLIYIKAG